MLAAASHKALVALHWPAACPAVVRVIVLNPFVLSLALTDIVVGASSQGKRELGRGNLFAPLQLG